MPSNHLIHCYPLSSCLQSFPASGSFPMTQFFTSGGQSSGASASVLPMNIQSRFSLGLTVWSPCSPRDIQESSPTPQFKSINSSALGFFIVQLSHPYMTTGKTIALSVLTFVSKVISLLFNMLYRLVIAFLPRSKSLNFMAAVTVLSEFGALENKTCHCFHFYPFYLPWSDRIGYHDLSFFECWVSSQLFHSPLSPSSRSSYSSSLLFATRGISPAYLRLLIFFLPILIPARDYHSPAFCLMYSACKLYKQGENLQP